VGDIRFATPPRGWRRNGLKAWRWTHRDTLAEEHEWRATRPGVRGKGWFSKETGVVSDAQIQDRRRLGPKAIAHIYRSLRKAREDAKDEPGAADFYFGEMEMRRHAETTRPAERVILTLYWLVSGYGLRGSRALIGLLVTVLTTAALLSAWGFQPEYDEGFVGALLYSLQSTTALLRAPEAQLTYTGQVIQIVVRLLGPLFFGLALLSLRNRVKR
jgi:hypothetical protein